MTPSEHITRENSGSGGRYVYTDPDGGPEAELTFSNAGATMRIADHTDVPEVYKGRGVGQALAQRLIDDARADGVTILPLCPFVAAMFRRHADWADVLAESARR